MQKKTIKYRILSIHKFKSQLIDYSRKLSCFCFLDSNSNSVENEFDVLLAFNNKKELRNSKRPFIDLKNIINNDKDWLFGFLTYDLKNNIEKLYSNNLDCQSFPKLHFFIPEIIIKIKNQDVIILYDAEYSKNQIDRLYNEINQSKIIALFTH